MSEDREMLDEYVPRVIFYEGEGYPFYEFVSEDSPTVTGRLFHANVEPLYDWREKRVIGFRIHVDAALTSPAPSPIPGPSENTESSEVQPKGE